MLNSKPELVEIELMNGSWCVWEEGGKRPDGSIYSIIIGNKKGLSKDAMVVKSKTHNNKYAAIPIVYGDIIIKVDFNVALEMNLSIYHANNIDGVTGTVECTLIDKFDNNGWKDGIGEKYNYMASYAILRASSVYDKPLFVRK